MLDHVFTDAIGALRDALESALLERQAFEERFQVDVLLGDVTWETGQRLDSVAPHQANGRQWILTRPWPPVHASHGAMGPLRGGPDCASSHGRSTPQSPQHDADTHSGPAPIRRTRHCCVTAGKNTDLYVRLNNSTRLLNTAEAAEYIGAHWR